MAFRSVSRLTNGEGRGVGAGVGRFLPPVVRAATAAAWCAFERDWLGGESGRPETEIAPSAADSWCRRCGGSVGPAESSSPCVACRAGAGVADGVVRLGEFAGDLRRQILDLKYGGRTELAEDLGQRLAEVVAREIAPDPVSTVVIAVPGATWRVWHRGVDHAAEVAREVARVLQVPVLKPLAHRGTIPRSGQAPRRRCQRSLRPRRGWSGRSLADLHVLLIDDVLTTGSTLREASRCLQGLSPSSITAGILAVAPRPERGGPAESRSIQKHRP
jgi:predicted amidophosphoribosyltransferase